MEVKGSKSGLVGGRVIFLSMKEAVSAFWFKYWGQLSMGSNCCSLAAYGL